MEAQQLLKSIYNTTKVYTFKIYVKVSYTLNRKDMMKNNNRNIKNKIKNNLQTYDQKVDT